MQQFLLSGYLEYNHYPTDSDIIHCYRNIVVLQNWDKYNNPVIITFLAMTVWKLEIVTQNYFKLLETILMASNYYPDNNLLSNNTDICFSSSLLCCCWPRDSTSSYLLCWGQSLAKCPTLAHAAHCIRLTNGDCLASWLSWLAATKSTWLNLSTWPLQNMSWYKNSFTLLCLDIR